MQLPISAAVVLHWIIDSHSLKICLLRDFVISLFIYLFIYFQLFSAYYIFEQGILQIQLQNFWVM